MTRGANRYGDGLSLRDAMNELIESAFLRPSSLGRTFAGAAGGSIPLNAFEDSDSYYLFFSVPGVQPESVEITSLNNVLTISGETASPAAEGWKPLLQEQPFGRFHHEISLPAPFGPEAVQASCEHGLLKITIPKASHQRVHRIKVQTSGE